MNEKLETWNISEGDFPCSHPLSAIPRVAESFQVVIKQRPSGRIDFCLRRVNNLRNVVIMPRTPVLPVLIRVIRDIPLNSRGGVQ